MLQSITVIREILREKLGSEPTDEQLLAFLKGSIEPNSLNTSMQTFGRMAARSDPAVRDQAFALLEEFFRKLLAYQTALGPVQAITADNIETIDQCLTAADQAALALVKLLKLSDEGLIKAIMDGLFQA